MKNEYQIEEAEKQIAIEKSKTTETLSEEDIKTYYKKALKLNGLTLVSYLIKQVKLYNDKAEIIFNSPLNKSPNSDSCFLFKQKFMIKPVQHRLPLRILMNVNYCI